MREMKMIKNFTGSILVNLSLIFTASAQIMTVDSSSMAVIKIDPQNARGAKVSDIFDEVEFIPLETSKASIFGSISRLKIIDENYVIFDFDTKSIFIFDKTGKFVNKIKSGNSKDIPSDLYYFEIVDDKSQQLIAIDDRKFLFYYDSKGSFLKKEGSKRRSKQEITPLENGFSLKEYWMDKDSISYEYALFKDDKPYTKFFPWKSNKNVGDMFYSANGSNQQDIRKNYFFTKRYSYDIYKITLPKVSLAYKIILPQDNSLPENFMNDPKYVGKINRKKFFDTYKNVVYGLSNIHQFGSNLFFKIGITGGTLHGTNALLYKLKNKETITLNKIEPDAMSFFLPINDSGSGFDFSNQGFLTCSGDYLFTSYSSLVMFKNKNINGSRSMGYNKVLEKYFKTESSRSNPVIIKLKPKSI